MKISGPNLLHEMWIPTQKDMIQIQAAEIRFLHCEGMFCSDERRDSEEGIKYCTY